MLNIPVSHIEVIDNLPMIARQRVKVKMIVNMYVRSHVPIEEIMEHYGLTEAEIHGALTYYYDNRDFFDQQYVAEEALLDKMAKPSQVHQAEIRAQQSKHHS